MPITSIIIDSREPSNIQNLTFGGIPKMVQAMEIGDLLCSTDDGCMLCIERKTTDDFLGSLKSERLYPQLARMAQKREDNQLFKAGKYYPYLVISGTFQPGANGKVISARGETGWSWAAVQGALLTIQEMGVFISYAANDEDFENAILRLGNRDRGHLQILPPRAPDIVGPQAAFIAGLPGIGIDRCTQIMRWAGNNPAHALWGLTDLEIDTPIGKGTRKKIRRFLGLNENDKFELNLGANDE